jgi:hypothetical protein
MGYPHYCHSLSPGLARSSKGKLEKESWHLSVSVLGCCCLLFRASLSGSGKSPTRTTINVMKQTLLLLVLLFFFTVGNVEAHPGRTDASGGHTCRTNCENWGLSYGEYHYHGGGSNSTGGSYTAPVQETVQESVILPTNTPLPTRIPTRIPTKTPTTTPTPTVKITVPPTKIPSPTIAPKQEVKSIQSSAVPQKQGFFSWLFGLFNFK